MSSLQKTAQELLNFKLQALVILRSKNRTYCSSDRKINTGRQFDREVISDKPNCSHYCRNFAFFTEFLLRAPEKHIDISLAVIKNSSALQRQMHHSNFINTKDDVIAVLKIPNDAIPRKPMGRRMKKKHLANLVQNFGNI